MNPDFADIAVYAELRERGELTARIYAAPLDPDWSMIRRKLACATPLAMPYLRIGAREGLSPTARSARAPRISSSPSPISRTIAACCRTKCSRLR